MHTPNDQEISTSQQPLSYRNFFSAALSSLRMTGQTVAIEAEQAQATSQEKMANRPTREALSPFHRRLRELALQEAFIETKELLHKLIDRLEARELPILFTCIKKLSETDIDNLQAFLVNIIDSINPDNIEEDLKNISSNLWEKVYAPRQLKKPVTRKVLSLPETFKAKFTKLGDPQLVVEKEDGRTLELMCPINLEIMSEPVKLKASGKIFERESILGWLQICRSNPRCPLTKLPVTERPFADAVVFDEDTQLITEKTVELGKECGYEILNSKMQINFERFQRIGKFNDITIQAIETLNTNPNDRIDQAVICPITKKIITRPVRFKDSSVIFDATSLDDLISQSLAKDTDELQVDIDGELVYASPEGLSKEESLTQFLDGIQTDEPSLRKIGMKVQSLVKHFIEENRLRQTQTMASSLQRSSHELASTATSIGASTAGLFAGLISPENTTRGAESTLQEPINLGLANRPTEPPTSLADPIMEPIDPMQAEQNILGAESDQDSDNSSEIDAEADLGTQSRI